MKKLSLLLILFIAIVNVNNVKGQLYNVPDSLFRQKLFNLGFGSCFTGNSIDAACPAVMNCDMLVLSNSNIRNLEGLQAFAHLRTLDCSNNSPVLGLNIPALPSSLTYFNCSGNSLIISPFSLPNGLEILICSNNGLTNIPFILPNSLTGLVCRYNYIDTILSLPSGLREFDCLNNRIRTLPALPAGLTKLVCSQNAIQSLPALPDSLKELFCENLPLSSLPALPPGLEHLYASNDSLVALPQLPASLKTLVFSYNKIDTLLSLPPQLAYLSCDHNQLTALPALPPSLRQLYVSWNYLTALPSDIGNLYDLNCSYNFLSSIPAINDTMGTFNCINNLSLSCLPVFNKVQNLSFSNCPVTCLPTYGNVSNSTPPLSTLPLCDVSNVNNCDFTWNISGKSFLDGNTNCVQSSSEPGLHNMHMSLYENGNLLQQIFTGDEGFYSFDVNSYSIFEVRLDTADIPFNIYCPSSNNYLDTITVSDSLSLNNNFALDCKTGVDLAVWSLVASPMRPGRLSHVIIRASDIAEYYGGNCGGGISGSLVITINGNAHYTAPSAGALIPSNVTGNVITYNIADFSQVNSNTDFMFEMELDTFATMGSQICIEGNISTTGGDYNLLNNNLSNCFTVSASFDPNFKEVYPKGLIDSSQHSLTYTIHFQNTGNAPAENIYLLDTLSNNIDISSFRILSTSHSSFVQILEGGIARFNLPDINLPDSIHNEPLSHGYVQYKVNLKNNLPIGTQIDNTAYIYFDYNLPVQTNTTSNTIDIINGIASNKIVLLINVWPVPFNNSFILETDIHSTGSRFAVLNLLGEEMESGVINATQIKVNAENWTTGIYFLRVENENGLLIRKLIKN